MKYPDDASQERDQSNSAHDSDQAVLHRMGYAQELARRMGAFSNFAISFSIICILAGGITMFPVALSSGGGFTVAVGWLVGGLIAMIVAIGMGQIASSFPTAGGLYHWSSHLGGKAWGWGTAWFNLLGLIFVVASVDVGAYTLLRELILKPMLGLGMENWTIVVSGSFTMDIWQLSIVALLLTSQALLNHFSSRLTTILTDLSGYLIFAVATLLIVGLLAWSPVPLEFARLITFENFTGPTGGEVFSAHPSALFAFTLSLLYVLYTITGFDASAHTSEETYNAQVNVPRGMWQAVMWSWIFGFLMLCTFVLVLPSVTEGASQGWNSFNYLYSSSRLPWALCAPLSIGLVICNYLCALACLTSCSRMVFAFARDGGLPFSKRLAHVSKKHRTPIYAIWTSIACAFVSTVYANAFVVLSTGSAVFLYLSYVMPIAAGFFAEGKVWNEKGPFNLGRWSKLNAVIAVLGGLLLAITGFFPPNEKVLYLTLAMIAVLVVVWYAGERYRFQGVPEGDKIAQRQKTIAEIEAKFTE